VTDSMKKGPSPARAASSAVRTAASTAGTSLPSTCTEGIPQPRERCASGTRDCTEVGTEIAHWLFCVLNSTGDREEAAKVKDSATSPSREAPSPNSDITAVAVR